MESQPKRTRDRETNFGRHLRKLREEAGLSKSELGERAGMAYQTIAKYERGIAVPTWPIVVRIVRALGTTTDSFFIAEGIPDDAKISERDMNDSSATDSGKPAK